MILSRGQARLLAVTFALLGLLPQVLSRTLPDIAFPLWAADRMQHGARLYVDILEINPPLFIWLDLPLTWLARVTGLGSITWYRIATSLLLFTSLGGCWWALNRALEDHPLAYRRLLWLAAAFSLLLLPRLDWGEREHLSLALTLPYILLGIARARGRSVPRGGAILSGLAAGVGIAFKPHFVLVWVGREVAARVGCRSARMKAAVIPAQAGIQTTEAPSSGPRHSPGRRASRMRHRHSGESRNPAHRSSVRWAPAFAGATAWETILVPLVCIAYLAAVVVIHPEYFHLVRELGWAYSRFLRNSIWITLFLGDGSAIVLGALVVVLALRAIPKERAVWRVLIGAMLGYFLAAVVQAKGWRYHFYPALGLAMLLLAAVAWDARAVAARGLMRLFGAMPAAALVTAVLVSAALAGRQIAQPLNPRYDADPSLGELIPLVKARAAGRPIFVFSPNMASGFPLVTYTHARWPARLPHLWPAVVAYNSAIRQPGPIRFRTAGSMTPLERFGVETTVEDILRNRPPLVLSLIAADQPGWGMQRLGMIRFLRRDTRFAAAWQAYDLLGRVGNYSVWARRDDRVASEPLAPSPAARTGHAPDRIRVNRIALAAWMLLLVVLGIQLRFRPQGPA